ncbi:MAG: Gfo/Idh/MocA family oxidoreductase [Verrucomicrobiae bacterium]|nr:Gfo/Idh/MocA family oxidoreductase [Verrucomicrobiae bacterium]
MANRYKVVIVGMGKRGMHHGTTFHANGRFEVAGICDIDKARLEAAAPKLGNPKISTNAAELVKEVKPDVFCFCTLPSLRLPMIKIGVEAKVKMLAFEKPVALTTAEGMQVRDMLKGTGIKTVVSHQHRYGVHYRKVAEIIASGALGRIHTVYGTSTGWMTHMMSHLIDYTRWYNGFAEAQWAMAQAAGRGKLADNHPSPDYISAVVQYANGVRGYYEAGAGAPDQPEVAKWWGKCRMGAQGTEGFAEVLTNGGWRAVTKSGGCQSGEGAMNYDQDMPPYIQDMADWLDDKKIHPCNFDSAYKGFEIMMACCRSATEGGQAALPLTDPKDELALLKAKVPDRKAIALPVNAKEFGL